MCLSDSLVKQYMSQSITESVSGRPRQSVQVQCSSRHAHEIVGVVIVAMNAYEIRSWFSGRGGGGVLVYV